MADMDALDPLLREALIAVAAICFPVLFVATTCGVLVAIVQAATQVQEQTLTLLPKLLAVGAMIVCFGPFAMRLCASLLEDVVTAIPAIVSGS
jgi:flagellar biosynthetic protein FliQ